MSRPEPGSFWAQQQQLKEAHANDEDARQRMAYELGAKRGATGELPPPWIDKMPEMRDVADFYKQGHADAFHETAVNRLRETYVPQAEKLRAQIENAEYSHEMASNTERSSMLGMAMGRRRSGSLANAGLRTRRSGARLQGLYSARDSMEAELHGKLDQAEQIKQNAPGRWPRVFPPPSA